MANDMWVQIDGIPGEGTHKGYEKWIQCEQPGQGLSHLIAGSRQASGGATQQQVSVSDFTFTANTGIQSAKIQDALFKGTHIKKVVLSCLASLGTGPVEWLKVTLTDVLISDYKVVVGTQGSGGQGIEHVSMNWGTYEWAYTEYDHKTAQKKGNNLVKYDATTAVTS